MKWRVVEKYIGHTENFICEPKYKEQEKDSILEYEGEVFVTRIKRR